MLSALNEPVLQNMAGRGSRAVLWMTGNADRCSAEALYPVVPILRLHIEQRAARKTRAIDKFRRCHRRHLVYRMLWADHWLPYPHAPFGTSEGAAKSRFGTSPVG
jgi:hypothetical protein